MVNGRGYNLISDCQDTEHRLQCPCTTQQVTCHRLGGADVELVAVVSEYIDDRFRFRYISHRCGCTMYVDVVDLIEIHLSILKCIVHHQFGTQPIGMGSGDMICIGRHASTCYFSIDLSTAGKCVLQLLKYEGCTAFTYYESVAAGAEGT